MHGKNGSRGMAIQVPLDPAMVLEGAMEYAWWKRPHAPAMRKAAFADTVMYLVTGWRGGYLGPSVRKKTAARLYGAQAGQLTFSDAVELLLRDDGPIFGPVTELHCEIWRKESCILDDPNDLVELVSSPSG